MVKKRERFPVNTRKRLRMEVVPEPKEGTAAVIKMETPNAPTFRGVGGTDYVCGACGFAVGVGLEPGQIQNLVLACSACGKFNRVTSPETN